MIAAKTTTITIRNETGSSDPYDPNYEQDSATATGVRASILEQNSSVTPDGVPIPRDITYAVGRVSQNIDVRKGATIVDEKTNKSWMVEEVARNANPVMKTDQRLALKRVD
jgi:hypothetical protein